MLYCMILPIGKAVAVLGYAVYPHSASKLLQGGLH